MVTQSCSHLFVVFRDHFPHSTLPTMRELRCLLLTIAIPPTRDKVDCRPNCFATLRDVNVPSESSVLQEFYMKNFLSLLAALFLSAAVTSAGPQPQPGTILSQT